MNRRTFLKASSQIGGCFVLSRHLPGFASTTEEQKLENKLGPAIKIDSDGQITIFVYKQEMGHGIHTGLAMLAAEEMCADWSKVSVKSHTFDSSFEDYQQAFGRFDTGGSNSMVTEWETMRTAGVSAKVMLVAAAAQAWGIEVDACQAKHGRIINSITGDVFTYGELAQRAALQPVPENVKYKPETNYTLIGQSVAALKARKIVDGSLMYGIDKKVDNMVYAAILRPPTLRGKLLSFDATAARKVNGVIAVIALPAMPNDWVLDRGIRGGVAVIGDSTWACFKGKNLVEAHWDEGPDADKHSASLINDYDQFAGQGDRINYQAGDVEASFQSASKVVERTYTSPFLPHLLMEPLNAIADFSDGKHLHIYSGTQSPGHSAHNLAKTLNIPKQNITVTPLYMGGGYGRRYFCDFMLEASLISKAVKLPVKLTWTREDEIQVGAYQPMRKDFLKCGLDEQGNIDSYAMASVSAHQWAGSEIPFDYGYQHIRAQGTHYPHSPVVSGSWRAVVMHNEYFAREVFIDELAHETGSDPLEYRIRQFKRPIATAHDKYLKQDNLAEVPMRKRIIIRLLQEVAEMAQWGESRGKNRGLGVACTIYHQSSFAVQIADVEVIDGIPKVHNVYCAADVGLAINPNLVRGQIESSILWALTPVLYGGVDVDGGRIRQSNFHDANVVRMAQSPAIHIRLFNGENRSPFGVGEFAVPPLAPAVSNAIFAATGKRHRHLHMA